MNRNEIRINEIFIDFIDNKKGISRHRKKMYETSLMHFTRAVDKDLTMYVDETKMKQLSYLKETEIINVDGEKQMVPAYIEPDIERGDLYKDFKIFYDYLKRKGISDVSADSYISAVRAFFRKQGIKLPSRIEISIPTNSKRILKQEKIRRAIEKADIRDKALFAFMASSGLRSKDVRNLKIKDLLKALELEEIEDIFTFEDNKIGYLEFKPSKTIKRGFFCKTCFTPYSVELIIQYLRGRRKTDDLKSDSYLFSSTKKSKKFSESGFRDVFRRMDEKLYEDDLLWFKKQLEVGNIRQNRYDEEINNISKFHAHGLRAFFINTISSHCSNLKVGAAMEGHKSPVDTDINYTNFNRSIIVNHYFPIIPYLNFNDTKVNILNEERIDKYEKIIGRMENKLKKHDMIIKEAEQAEEDELIFKTIMSTKHLKEAYDYIVSQKNVDFTNKKLLRDLVELDNEKSLNTMKIKEWKQLVDDLIKEIGAYSDSIEFYKVFNSKLKDRINRIK